MTGSPPFCFTLLFEVMLDFSGKFSYRAGQNAQIKLEQVLCNTLTRTLRKDMADFPVHKIDETEDPVIKGLLGSMKQKYGGMEANIFGVMANSPTVLKGYIGLSLIFDKSSLTKAEQQLVLLTASAKNQCTYCVPSHSTMVDTVDEPVAK